MRYRGTSLRLAPGSNYLFYIAQLIALDSWYGFKIPRYLGSVARDRVLVYTSTTSS